MPIHALTCWPSWALVQQSKIVNRKSHFLPMPDPPPSSKRPIPAGATDPRSAPASVAGTGGSGASGLSGMSSAGVGSGGSTGSPASGSGVAKLGAGKAGRQRFAADELAIVLSHYDLGTIEKIQEYPRGSRKAPKLILLTGFMGAFTTFSTYAYLSHTLIDKQQWAAAAGHILAHNLLGIALFIVGMALGQRLA